MRPGVRVFARGVQGAERPAGLVELCAPTGCTHLLATSAGFSDLGLGRATAGGVEVQRSALGGYVARADAVRDGVPVVTLVAVSDGGVVTARRTYVLAGRSDEAHTGTWDGADGLWIGDRAGHLRFVAIDARDVDGATTGVPVPDARTGGCATSAGPARGTVRMLQRVSQVRGPGWFVEAGEWQTEEVLEVGDAGACVRSITSGEARDEDEMRANGREEHEPVRSFALRATGACAGGAGGGGSGGVVFLYAPSVTVASGAAVSAIGGTGGPGATIYSNTPGGAGGLGRIRISALSASCSLGGAFNPPLLSACSLTPGAGSAGSARAAANGRCRPDRLRPGPAMRNSRRATR